MLDLGVVSYFDQTRNALSLADFGAGLIKAVVYGSLVAVSGCLRPEWLRSAIHEV